MQINGKDVTLLKHCRERMQRRRISEAEIYTVLINRDITGITVPAKNGRQNIFGTVEGRRLRVTVEESNNAMKVVTVVAPDEEDNA